MVGASTSIEMIDAQRQAHDAESQAAHAADASRGARLDSSSPRARSHDETVIRDFRLRFADSWI